jgi:quercetin dioxygenase-like cupin family protein
MNRRTLAVTLVLAVAISTGMVLARGGVAAAKGAMHAKAVTMAPDDLKWEAMPGVEGVQVAMLWGNMSKGGYGAFVKLPPNQVHPLHTHSAGLKVVVLSGEFKYGPAGGPEKSYGAGSYLMIPGGLRHSSASGDGELLMFQESTGAWDLKPVGAAAAAK